MFGAEDIPCKFIDLNGGFYNPFIILCAVGSENHVEIPPSLPPQGRAFFEKLKVTQVASRYLVYYGS
jgi:hypothetical protein